MIRRFLESLLNFWDDHFSMSVTGIVAIGVLSFLSALAFGVFGVRDGNLARVGLYWGVGFLFLLIIMRRKRR